MIRDFIEQDSYKAIDDIYKTILNVAIISNLFAALLLGSFGKNIPIIFLFLLFFIINVPLRFKFDIKNRYLISSLFHINTVTVVTVGVMSMGWNCGIWITLLGDIFISYFLAFNKKVITYLVSIFELFILLLLYFLYKDSSTTPDESVQKLTTALSVIFTYYLVFRLSGFADAITSSGYRQITREKEELEENSKYDFLTGLLNRRSIEKILKDMLLELRGNNSDTNLVVMLGDIDNFKNINDTYGHDWGDKVLKEIAVSLKDTFRGNDTICRWGGEEFLVILPKIKTADIKNIETRLSARVAQVKLPDKSAVTMTFGLVLCATGVSIDMDTLINIADKKLYEGKKNGKDRIEYAILKKGHIYHDNA